MKKTVKRQIAALAMIVAGGLLATQACAFPMQDMCEDITKGPCVFCNGGHGGPGWFPVCGELPAAPGAVVKGAAVRVNAAALPANTAHGAVDAKVAKAESKTLP